MYVSDYLFYLYSSNIKHMLDFGSFFPCWPQLLHCDKEIVTSWTYRMHSKVNPFFISHDNITHNLLGFKSAAIDIQKKLLIIPKTFIF
jgi:hypothetical protein